MLIHCLTFTFKASATPQQIDALHVALADLPQQLPFTIRSRQGHDLGERGTNADYGLVSEFENVEDFHAYLEHPAHRALPVAVVESYTSVQFVVDS